MKTYRSTKANRYSNRIVAELNAAVCTSTFANRDGKQLADLYTCRNSADVLVSHGTCDPVGGVFVETVTITFE